jgi:hypothetical protein
MLLALAVGLAGCGGGDGGVTTGSPEIGTPAARTTAGSGTTAPGAIPAVPSSVVPGSGTTEAGGSGNTASPGIPAVTTPSTTVGGDPAVAVELGGPSLFIPHLQNPSESFGEVAVGADSPPHRLQVRSPLQYRATIVALEPGGASFRLSEDRCTGITLPPAGSGGCTITVTFSPREAGQALAGISIRMTHTCTSDTYVPCSWTPEQIAAPGTAPNFTRVVLPNGRARFEWTTGLGVLLVGQGAEAADTTTPATT